jgi:hypothetical protein
VPIIGPIHTVAENDNTESESKMSVWQNVISPPLPVSREGDAAERRIPKALAMPQRDWLIR